MRGTKVVKRGAWKEEVERAVWAEVPQKRKYEIVSLDPLFLPVEGVNTNRTYGSWHYAWKVKMEKIPKVVEFVSSKKRVDPFVNTPSRYGAFHAARKFCPPYSLPTSRTDQRLSLSLSSLRRQRQTNQFWLLANQSYASQEEGRVLPGSGLELRKASLRATSPRERKGRGRAKKRREGHGVRGRAKVVSIPPLGSRLRIEEAI